jgi:hypothetical protein
MVFSSSTFRFFEEHTQRVVDTRERELSRAMKKKKKTKAASRKPRKERTTKGIKITTEDSLKFN